MTTVANPLPHLVRDLPSVVSLPFPAVADVTKNVVCRTVVVRADRERLQLELERELRTLLGFGGRIRH